MRRVLGLIGAVFVVLSAGAALVMPEIISHRGESQDRPENSMAAYRLAFERGVDGVECDVYATTDGKGVLIHDATTGRTAGSGTNLTVTACTWDQLKDVRIGAFGSWVGTEYESETIPLLDDYLALLASNTTTKCVIELKSSANSAVDVVTTAIKAQSLATKDRVVFISFDTTLISAIRTALPDYEAWLLLDSGTYTGANLVSKIEACNATGVDVNYQATVSADDIAVVKAAGYKYEVWTCDNATTAFELVQKGVDGITTNTGKTLKDALQAQVDETNTWGEIYDATQPRGATSWDVTSYVQDGLVGHFDGIRNAGADQVHDSQTKTWKNLVAGQADATVVVDAAAGGCWLPNGFHFNADGTTGGYAQVDSPGLTLGTACTVQLATDYDYTLQPTGTERYPNIFCFSSDNESAFFLNNNNTTGTCSSNLVWKTEPYGESKNTRRPTLIWEGKYLTAILADKKYLTQTTELGTAVDRGATVSIANQRMSWGASCKYPTQMIKRYSLGTVYAVRLYNRALTEAELVQNRQVDEIRYRGNGVNVVVESNKSEFDVGGFYTVNGTATFAAPANVTKDGLTWAPTGYKLELWDATKETWDLLRSEDSLEYVHTNCAARAKVRLTWNWRLAQGAKRIDADDYVQAGLLVQFDGIRNTGLTTAHDDATNIWKNLASAGGDATWTALNTTTPGAWLAKGYDFKGSDYFKVDVPFTLGRQATLQIASDYNDDVQKTAYPQFFGNAADCFNSYSFWTKNNVDVDRGDRISFKADKTTKLAWNTRPTLQPWHGRIVNAVLDYNRSGLGQTADLVYKAGKSFGADVGRQAYWIGTAGANDSDRKARMLVGRIYAVRVYDRVLSTAELAHNLEIDQIRFHVGAGRSTDTDLVEVASELPSDDNSDLGAWLLRGDVEKTFTATETVKTANAAYTCAGYRLETWNAAKRQWENPQVVADATSCTLQGTTGAANRKVTWLWTRTQALLTAADYDVDDYVQQGLIAHFDGIRNRGLDCAHATRGMAWRDISYRGADLLLSSATNWMAWSTNSLILTPANQTYARMTETIDLGTNATLQAVLDIDPSKQTTAYPCYFGSSLSDHGLFTRNTGNTLEWKLDNWCYSGSSYRSKATGWEGKYITSEIMPKQTFLTQTTDLGTAKARQKYTAMDGLYWTLGASGHAYDSNDLKVRCVNGIYYAARFYNRALTEAELVQNRKVDEIRYRGNFANYRNVEIAADHETAQGTETNGVYEVVGSWTFTAAPITVTSASGHERTVQPSYRLETLVDGTWSAPVTHTGGSYTYTAGGNPVRLTWCWSVKSGTMILFR